jgi:tetratricopeptide (TPR) repeat protein
MSAAGHNSTGGKRLDSWKEIGAFFNRDERTVKRWETTRGLPVHRVPGGGRVYAYTEELKAWLESSRGQPETAEVELPQPAAQQPPESASVEEVSRPNIDRRPGVSPAFVAVIAVLLIGGIFLIVRPPWRSREVVAAHSVKHKADPKAEQFYLTGIYYWHKRTPDSLNQAVDSFTQAIVVDPNYAPAYVGLADCYNLLREYSSMPPEEAYPRAIAAARRAIILDDSLAGAHSSLAFAEFYWSWQVADAEKEFRRAIELSPNSVQAHHWYATSLLELARFPEAVEEINRAQALDPQSTAILADKGLILYYSGRKDEGTTLLKRLEVSDPTFLSTHGYLAGIGLIEGDHEMYLSEARKAAEVRHDADAMTVVEASEHGFARGGPRAMLAGMMEAQKKLHASGKTSAYALAETSGMLGDDRGAMAYLNESYEKHESALVGMRISPFFGGLHKDAQFQEMIKKVGLPPL